MIEQRMMICITIILAGGKIKIFSENVKIFMCESMKIIYKIAVSASSRLIPNKAQNASQYNN